MVYKDGETFTTYCDKPYDRHHYELVLKNGQKVMLEDYETLRGTWYHYKEHCSHVNVVDKPTKGFK